MTERLSNTPVLTGVGASAGVGVGPAVVVGGTVPEPRPIPFDGDRTAELDRALGALEAVAIDLADRGRRAGGDARAVLEAQALIARDPGLADEIARHITGGATGARAVFDAFGSYRTLLEATGSYMSARIVDLDDVRDRAVAQLLGIRAPGIPPLSSRCVLVARDLAPADTALLDPALVAAFVTEEGGPTSHTAILARTMGIPAVVACTGATAVAPGTQLVVDGTAGRVVVAPDDATVAAAAADADRPTAAVGAVSGPGGTADGCAVPLLANVGGVPDIESALAAGAEGIGLFRTEFAFLERLHAPTEDEQTALYHDVLGPLSGRRVVARLLDVGSDKPLAFLGTSVRSSSATAPTPVAPSASVEPNPALGVRGLRALLGAPDILAAQLRALNRAASHAGARLELMAPMVADAEDAAAFVAAARGSGFAGPLGVMVEVPAAALSAAAILEHVDFVSLGTNDLAQYAFAADRQVGALARYQDPWQPALLRLVAATAAAARDAGKPCGVCGEAAADPALACVFVGLGVTSLSMSSGALAPVRAALAAHTIEACTAAAAAALMAASGQRARDGVREHLPSITR